jgi:hypothetical protein
MATEQIAVRLPEDLVGFVDEVGPGGVRPRLTDARRRGPGGLWAYL